MRQRRTSLLAGVSLLSADRGVFATNAGRKLSFAKLLAKDAAGQSVPARFELASPKRLRLVIDERSARYPLVIDPLLTSIADATLQSNQVVGSLGASHAGAGDVNGDGCADVIVGEPVLWAARRRGR